MLVKGCVDNGRADMAELVIKEFESNGVRVREGTRLYLEQRKRRNAAELAAAAAAAAAEAGSEYGVGGQQVARAMP